MDKLSGITVVDLTQFLPEPMLSLMMADRGARMIKTEPPTGDPARCRDWPQSSMTSHMPAPLIGPDDHIGRIVPGLQADFVRLDDQLLFTGTWIDGEPETNPQ